MSTVILLTQNLRAQNNAVLQQAIFKRNAGRTDKVHAIYIFEGSDDKPKNYTFKSLGSRRRLLLEKSLEELSRELSQKGISLEIFEGETLNCLGLAINKYDARTVIAEFRPDFYWQSRWHMAKTRWREIDWLQTEGNTLLPVHSFDQESLEKYYGGSFSRFRKHVQKNDWLSMISENWAPDNIEINHAHDYDPLQPGEKNALQYLEQYFSSQNPLSYKETRNSLEGRFTSTGLSVALANGFLSAKSIYKRLQKFEQANARNASTEWIEFELLWRDYFHGYAQLHKAKLFYFSGITGKSPLTSSYGQRLRMWCAGSTPWPLVNACMRQLNETGFMSNRGRQIVVSCLINELQVDWRYGAAYFQQQLLDYDVASNWGNWQYIAGVGPDPRGGRHFNIEKQTALYDPEGVFCAKWQANSGFIPDLDSVDAADWPLL